MATRTAAVLPDMQIVAEGTADEQRPTVRIRCSGTGFLRYDVPVGDPNFGRSHPCGCKTDVSYQLERVETPDTAIAQWLRAVNLNRLLEFIDMTPSSLTMHAD